MSTLPKKMTGPFCPLWRCLTVHTRGHMIAPYLYTSLTTAQNDRRILLFYPPAKSYGHNTSDITIRHIMHEADSCQQAEEQGS